MFNKVVIFGSLVVVTALPLCAQDYSKGSFNIGGGVTTPLNPTANYTGISGNFTAGGGYNINRHDGFIGEFMWNGLPPSINVFQRATAPTGSVNLYSLTANYRYQIDHFGGSAFGVYAIGGGWFYRHISVDKNYVVPPNTICQPIYTWWGYACDPYGYVYSAEIAHSGVSAGGVDAGAGLTFRLSDEGRKFYLESRYIYAWTNRLATTVIPVTFGFRYN